MTLTNTEAVTDLSILESLDFEPELPCEHPQHDVRPTHGGPGSLLIRRIAPCGCREPKDLVICRPVWQSAGLRGLHCADCLRDFTRDEMWTLLKVIR